MAKPKGQKHENTKAGYWMGINRTGGGTWRSKARSRTPRIQEPRLTRRQRQQALDQLEHDQALAAAEATQIGTTD